MPHRKPHPPPKKAVVLPPPKKKDHARMLKCECPKCGYIARTSRRWIRDVGTPCCPDHGSMICDE